MTQKSLPINIAQRAVIKNQTFHVTELVPFIVVETRSKIAHKLDKKHQQAASTLTHMSGKESFYCETYSIADPDSSKHFFEKQVFTIYYPKLGNYFLQTSHEFATVSFGKSEFECPALQVTWYDTRVQIEAPENAFLNAQDKVVVKLNSIDHFSFQWTIHGNDANVWQGAEWQQFVKEIEDAIACNNKYWISYCMYLGDQLVQVSPVTVIYPRNVLQVEALLHTKYDILPLEHFGKVAVHLSSYTKKYEVFTWQFTDIATGKRFCDTSQTVAPLDGLLRLECANLLPRNTTLCYKLVHEPSGFAIKQGHVSIPNYPINPLLERIGAPFMMRSDIDVLQFNMDFTFYWDADYGSTGKSLSGQYYYINLRTNSVECILLGNDGSKYEIKLNINQDTNRLVCKWNDYLLCSEQCVSLNKIPILFHHVVPTMTDVIFV